MTGPRTTGPGTTGPRMTRRFERLLDGWTGEPAAPAAPGATDRGRHHLEQETAQVHLAAAATAPPEPHDDSMLERVGIAVLSGGSSAR